MKLSSLFLAASSACLALAATPQDWKSKSIYFMMTDRFARTDGSTTAPCNLNDRKYCGGTWRGIINKLDYIKSMGFSAIWITPVTHQIEGYTKYGEAFHGYWQNDIYSLNQHLGTPADLKALASALHAKGMYLMVDVVANHFAWSGTPYNVDYSTYRPFNDASYFHKPCNIDNYDNQTQVEDCWLAFNSGVELPDLDTRQQRVKDIYYNWIADLTKTYSIDGLRVDTVKHVQKDFWPGFNKASGVYNVGEVFSGDPNYLCPYQDVMDGVLNYAYYFPLTRAFQSPTGSMSDLVNEISQVKTACKDTNLLGTFLENHDNPRFPNTTSDLALAKNAIGFTFMADGIPILYYGQEQHLSGGNDPYDREALWLSGYNQNAPLYKYITMYNKIRSTAIAKDSGFVNYKASVIWSDANTIALRKGNTGSQIVSVFSNKGENGNTYDQYIRTTGYQPGTEVVEIFTCQKQKVDTLSQIKAAMSKGEPRIYFPTAKAAGSGICGL